MANSIGLTDNVIRRYVLLVIMAIVTTVLGLIIAIAFGGAISWFFYGEQMARDGARTMSDLLSATVSPTAVIYPMGYGIGLLIASLLFRKKRKISWHWLALLSACVCGSAALPLLIFVTEKLAGPEFL